MKWLILLVMIPSMAQAFLTNDQVLAAFNEKRSTELTVEAMERIESLGLDDLIYDLDEIPTSDKENEVETLLESVDRRHCDNPAISQIGGVCTSHGVTNAMDNTACNGQDSSNEDLWSKYRFYNTRSALIAASTNRICEEKDWPNGGVRSPSCTENAHIKLQAYKYIGSDLDKAKTALSNGHAIVYSGRVTVSWANCNIAMDPLSPTVNGAHAIAIVGYRDAPTIRGGGYFITLGSWGPNCGDQGYQYLPYHYLERRDRNMYASLYEIIAVDSTYVSPSITIDEPGEVPEVTPGDNCRRVRTCRWPRLRRGCGPWMTVCD